MVLAVLFAIAAGGCFAAVNLGRDRSPPACLVVDSSPTVQRVAREERHEHAEEVS